MFRPPCRAPHTLLLALLLAPPVAAALPACDDSRHASHAAHEAPGAPVDSHAHQGAPAGAASLADLPEGVNAVQNEMRLLDAAMRETLTLIANGQLDAVPATIHGVHTARGLTEQALERGLYQPPKNPGDVAGFVATDSAFHDTLVDLVRASQDGDLPAASEAYGRAVVGCTNCHQQYRVFPSAAP